MYLKTKKIIHEDIKEDNILLKYQTTGTIAKIADFGIISLDKTGDS
jgi:serine/threonine protein kinase